MPRYNEYDEDVRAWVDREIVNGRDLWPEVPFHIRLTERGHNQRIFPLVGV